MVNSLLGSVGLCLGVLACGSFRCQPIELSAKFLLSLFMKY